MSDFNLEQVGNVVTHLIKSASWFPYKTGNLKFGATEGAMYDDDTYRIHFDSSVAPYVTYLEEGTGPHDIFPTIKQALRFTVNGKMVFAKKVHHPGSTKHQGFISEKCVQAIINYITSRYEGEVVVE